MGEDRVQLRKGGTEATPYNPPKRLEIGRYDPRLRDRLVVINPSNDKKYTVGGRIVVDSGAWGLSMDTSQYQRMKNAIGPINESLQITLTAAGPILRPIARKLAYCAKKACVKGDVGSNLSGVTLLGMDFLETAG